MAKERKEHTEGRGGRSGSSHEQEPYTVKGKGKGGRKTWEDAICSICMNPPHSAVLLLCSSHAKGCRAFVCNTGCRHSNCLEQFQLNNMNRKMACPLCRGHVKGWTVVEEARRNLNGKVRSCSLESCPFEGDYAQLRNHVRSEHPHALPTQPDPARNIQWANLQRQHQAEEFTILMNRGMDMSVSSPSLELYILASRAATFYHRQEDNSGLPHYHA